MLKLAYPASRSTEEVIQSDEEQGALKAGVKIGCWE